MIWGHDPPRTHEKITGKTDSFRAFCFPFFRFARKEEKMNIYIKEETLGQRIRAQRIRLGMTQEELAEALFVEKSTISYYENDKKEMRAGGLADMARVLQTTPNYLLGYTNSDDGFLSEALSLLEGIKDETVKKVLLAQIKAVSAL
jgi:transcriptional regulator with XRE-family HTH domain